jgi:hypothetical protein
VLNVSIILIIEAMSGNRLARQSISPIDNPSCGGRPANPSCGQDYSSQRKANMDAISRSSTDTADIFFQGTAENRLWKLYPKLGFACNPLKHRVTSSKCRHHHTDSKNGDTRTPPPDLICYSLVLQAPFAQTSVACASETCEQESYSHPLVLAIRAASTRLLAPSLLIASER